MNYQRKRYLYVLSTKFLTKKETLSSGQWKNIVDLVKNGKFNGIFTSWNSELNEQQLPDCSGNWEKISDKFHTTLDKLCEENDFILDILWLSDTILSFKKFPICLLGALKRAVDWHNCTIHLISNKVERQPFLQELRVRNVKDLCDLDLDPKLIWRGALYFYL